MNRRELEKNIVITIALVAGVMLLEGLLILTLQVMLSGVMSNGVNAFTIALSIVLSMLVFPFCLIRKTHNVTMKDLGVKRLLPSDYIMILCSISLVFMLVYVKEVEPITVLFLIIQNMFVALGEEFVFRSCMFYILRKMIKNEIVIIAIVTLVFVFVFHSGASVVENAVWRLPVAIVLGVLYSKKNTLFYVVLLHFVYNMVGALI